ncbi:TlpA family protein disulfide reductase [Rhodanobacter umsongensis]|uniref:TlpA family protein disulfide reductase n=1 Tax=Rhodanobacter umsongensis TaxID=633153 RepID=A0ABW0JJZ2_9GAMM
MILGLAVLAAAAGGYMQHRGEAPTATGAALVGRQLPDLTLPDLDGKLHRLSDYRGRRVLLNLWASWCKPCLQEMPSLAHAQEEFGDHAPIVVGIAMDDPLRARAFLAAHPANYPILLGRLSPPSTSLALGNMGEMLPYSVLIDADGQVLATHAGAIPAAQLRQWFGPARREP